MVGRLEGKVSIVTGAGRGIGRAIALRFANEGAAVVAVQRTLADGEQVAAEIERAGGRAFAVSTDIADPDSVEDMVAQTLETYGRVDVLCNNAGIGGVQNLLELTMERYDRVMDTNVRGLLLCMKHALKPMLEQGEGSIINVGSITSFVGLPESIIYCASKGAVLNLTRQASLDWAPKGVRVNLVAPGVHPDAAHRFILRYSAGSRGSARGGDERHSRRADGHARRRGRRRRLLRVG